MHYLAKKRRTREHIIADLGVNHAERIILRCGHTLERFSKDYGIDLVLFMYDNNGEYQNGDVRFQVKATDAIRPVKNGTIPFRIETAHLRHWLREPMPVILIMYDAARDAAFWLYVQQYFALQGKSALRREQNSVTVKLPAENILDDAAVRQFSQFRNKVLAQVFGVIRHDE
jgi:hypothetical protein